MSAGFPVPNRHPRVAHFMPYLVGDSIRAIARAKRLRFNYIDQNGHCDNQGNAWVLHWSKYRKQYPWYFTGRYVGRGLLRREERRRVPASWPDHFGNLNTAQAWDLRSARIGGTRPHRAIAHMAEAARVGITWCYEVKNSAGFLQEATWEQLGRDRDQVGARVIVMTLQNQGGNALAYTRLRLAAQVGRFPVALLPRGKRPAEWFEKWQPLGVKLWGRWR